MLVKLSNSLSPFVFLDQILVESVVLYLQTTLAICMDRIES